MGLSQKSLTQNEKKNFLVQGSYESLKRLEGKTGEGPFFKVRSDRITVIFLMDKEKRFVCNWTIFENMQANLPIKTSQLSIFSCSQVTVHT